LDVSGLLSNIYIAALSIDLGRKGIAVRGKADEGRELQFCNETDTDSHSSLMQAVHSFDDAFRVLDVVEDKTLYAAVDKSYPYHNKKYRIGEFPKDAYHIACQSHRTRIQNILRTPGLDQIEKSLLKQRHANLSTAQKGYAEKQKKTLKLINK